MAERIKELEIKQEFILQKLDKHDEAIEHIEKNLGTLVNQVGQIRNALYAMAVVIAFNIPALQALPKILLTVLGI